MLRFFIASRLIPFFDTGRDLFFEMACSNYNVDSNQYYRDMISEGESVIGSDTINVVPEDELSVK